MDGRAGVAGWGAEVAVLCGCGAWGRREVGQVVRGGRLGWDAEFRCGACGDGGCLGSGGEDAPDWVRGPLLERYGPVLVRLVGPGADRGAVLRVVRAAWPVTLPQAAGLLRQLAGDGLAGTPAEAAWLCGRLAERGVAAEAVPGQDVAGAGRPWGLPG
ncbi:hypothetical protein ACFVT9_14570 [Kitasatospora cineracea]|uniref:hypothetical protein n=1 Tax=Kitasatospora cineracea TaxID=88074 RepID=UPI0036DE2DA2